MRGAEEETHNFAVERTRFARRSPRRSADRRTCVTAINVLENWPGPGEKRPRRLGALGHALVHGNCMARLISTTVRLEEEDVRALQRARAAGYSASALIRKGLRVVASRYYTGRRPPSTCLFESTDNKLGDESELFRDLKA